MSKINIILLFLIWRILLFLVAFISPIIIPHFGAKFPYFNERLISSGLPHFIWSFGNFDGVHYLGIAKDAYAYQFTQVFFPVYPILIRAVSIFTFGNLLISALLVSNTAFLFALLVFHKLVQETFDRKIAFWSLLFLLAFPTSFFFGSIYTEGLFFLEIIGAFYLFSKKKILLGSVVGAIASATRLIGLLLSPSFYFGKNKKSPLPLLIVPLGFLSYVIYLQIKFNNPLYFLSAQSVFGQERSAQNIILFPQVAFRYLKILTTTSGASFFTALFELTATIFAFGIIFIYFKKIPRDWAVFSVCAILIPTLTGTLISMPRYILVAFPIYVGLALIKSDLLKIAILAIFLALLLISTIRFTQGYWVA